ncbi:MAG: tetratricopeptide repeat protein [Flavobacteriaceae bacterium]|nr:tetratricopeptide repeat protein [Flavobacteriaceae bacterium]
MNHKNLIRFLSLIIVLFLTINTNILAQAGTPLIKGDYVYYYPKLQAKNLPLTTVKSNLADVLKQVHQVYDPKNKKDIFYQDIKEILVLEDRIEVKARSKKNNLTLPFSKLIDSTFIFYTYQKVWHYVYFPSLVNFVFSDLNNAQKLADDVYFIQYPLINKRRDSLINIFKPLAAQYGALKVKPPVSEEQRRLIVQANLLNQQKEYFDAIGLYKKAIKLDPTAYPTAYSNIALLYAQVNFFDYAIFFMKKYLLLEPNATDSRSAQDKIYEWEIMMQK